MSVTIYTESGETDLNVANGNFADLWRFLGLPLDLYGTVTGAELRAVVFDTKNDREGLVSATVVDRNVISHGRSSEQVDRYFETLEQIASEAIANREVVTWS